MQRRSLLLLHGRLWQGRKQSWDWNLDGGSVPCQPLAVDRRAVVAEERRRASDQQCRNWLNWDGEDDSIRCFSCGSIVRVNYCLYSVQASIINRGRQQAGEGCWAAVVEKRVEATRWGGQDAAGGVGDPAEQSNKDKTSRSCPRRFHFHLVALQGPWCSDAVMLMFYFIFLNSHAHGLSPLNTPCSSSLSLRAVN
jgi:hypothetical protein